MKIVADYQIPQVQEAFSGCGEIIVRDGRQIDRTVLTNVDVLLVRSVTPVNADLLEHSPVRFIGSATSGVDHVDLDYLNSRNIAFASAHGSNARSVVEYVLSSLFVLAQQTDFNPFTKTVGIIGCGAVGSRLLDALQTLGIECVVNDPPLQEKTGDKRYCDLGTIQSMDIISLHVPLTRHGHYPTRYLVNKEFLDGVQADAILINTSRGGVIDEKILLNHINKNNRFNVVLDVWENEPEIDHELLKKVVIGTPHIAGYSIDGKIRATEMLYKEFCRHFKLQPIWKPAENFKKMGQLQIKIATDISDQDAIQLTVLSHFDVRSDAVSMRRSLEIDRHKTGFYFDELRKNYPVRREFPATTVHLPASKTRLATIFQKLGFNIITADK